jgi:hypothetical protein
MFVQFFIKLRQLIEYRPFHGWKACPIGAPYCAKSPCSVTMIHNTASTVDSVMPFYIMESGEINPSLKALNPNDARYGDGQYLSDILPGTKTLPSLSKCFLNNPFRGQRFTNSVTIDTAGLNVVMGRPNVYVVLNQVPLNVSSRILYTK